MRAESAPYLPFADGRFRLALGLMPLGEAEWLEPDVNFAADLAAKRALLATRPAEVFAALPEAAQASAGLLELLAKHLPRHHADLFRRDGDLLENRATGERWDLAASPLHPLALAGRLVQEDFCLLVSDGATYRLVGASLCSPSRWRLADKLGRPLAGVHEPVPGYDTKLAQPVDRFLAHLKPGKLVWRLNWGIHDDPAPFQPVPPPPRPVTAETAGENLWLRVERQTLRRLASGGVVFTIRTHIASLSAALGKRETAASLAAALRDMPSDSQRYKGIAPFAAPLLAWLDAR